MELLFVRCGGEHLGRSDLRDLVASALSRPDAGKVDPFSGLVDSSRRAMYLAMHDDGIVGQLTVTRGGEGTEPARDVAIESISVRESWLGRGVGRFLITRYVKTVGDIALDAETDDEAVGFFHSVGFRVRSLEELPPGTVRYRCRFDDAAFEPLPYREAVSACTAAGIPCWVAGGWALDLFHGRQTREHGDTDILIRREDQERLFDAFPGWEIYRTHAPGLGHWNGVPFLDTTSNVWLRRTEDSPWGLEVMFMDARDGEWVYRRNPAIRGRLDEMGLVTADGIPYLRPEIQLLYKVGSSVRREKDTEDMLRILPILPADAKAWLAGALRTQFPDGHDWLRHLEMPPRVAQESLP
jgi:GNAT superfamily N-acetyltransferase